MVPHCVLCALCTVITVTCRPRPRPSLATAVDLSMAIYRVQYELVLVARIGAKRCVWPTFPLVCSPAARLLGDGGWDEFVDLWTAY
jgi:hypothetical protein